MVIFTARGMRVMSEWADIYLCGDWGRQQERSATCLDLGQGDENNCFIRSHYKPAHNMRVDVTMWPITRWRDSDLHASHDWV